MNTEEKLPPIDYFALMEVWMRADYFYGPLFSPWCSECAGPTWKGWCERCHRQQ